LRIVGRQFETLANGLVLTFGHALNRSALIGLKSQDFRDAWSGEFILLVDGVAVALRVLRHKAARVDDPHHPGLLPELGDASLYVRCPDTVTLQTGISTLPPCQWRPLRGATPLRLSRRRNAVPNGGPCDLMWLAARTRYSTPVSRRQRSSRWSLS
jgi:hypothetical protein